MVLLTQCRPARGLQPIHTLGVCARDTAEAKKKAKHTFFNLVMEIQRIRRAKDKKPNSTVTFPRFIDFRSARAACSTASCRCWRLIDASRRVYLPLEPTGRTLTTEWKRGRGCNSWLLFTVNFGQTKKVKMLDPSGCFYFTVPRIAVLVLLGPEQKIARLIANDIANTLYFKVTLKLHTTKSYTGWIARDYQSKVTKLMR